LPVWPAPGFTESPLFTFPSLLLRYFPRGISKERCAAVPQFRCTTREPVNYCASPNFFDAEIRRAKQYEKEDKLLLLNSFLDNGKPLTDIVKTMNLPKTTVARMIKQLRPPKPRPFDTLVGGIDDPTIDKLEKNIVSDSIPGKLAEILCR